MDNNKLIENISAIIVTILLICGRIYTVRPVVILNEKSFFITSIFIGLFLAAIWMYIFFRINRGYFIKEKRRIGSLFCQTVSIVIASIFLIGFYNYQTGKKNIFHQKSAILDKWYYSRTKAGYFKMNVMDHIEKIDVRTSTYESFKIGDTIDLTIGRGGSGYFVIYKLDKL